MKIDSPGFNKLMKFWSDEAWKEEMAEAEDTWLENEDYHGRLETIDKEEK